MEVKPTYLGTMIALATAAFGLIAALAWNTAITDFFKRYFRRAAACFRSSFMRSSSRSSRSSWSKILQKLPTAKPDLAREGAKCKSILEKTQNRA